MTLPSSWASQGEYLNKVERERDEARDIARKLYWAFKPWTVHGYGSEIDDMVFPDWIKRDD
jgi:hypothetical protein